MWNTSKIQYRRWFVPITDFELYAKSFISFEHSLCQSAHFIFIYIYYIPDVDDVNQIKCHLFIASKQIYPIYKSIIHVSAKMFVSLYWLLNAGSFFSSHPMHTKLQNEITITLNVCAIEEQKIKPTQRLRTSFVMSLHTAEFVYFTFKFNNFMKWIFEKWYIEDSKILYGTYTRNTCVENCTRIKSMIIKIDWKLTFFDVIQCILPCLSTWSHRSFGIDTQQSNRDKKKKHDNLI